MRQLSIIKHPDPEEGTWSWVFFDPDGDVRLQSNLTYPSFHAAAKAASIAYPGVPMAPPSVNPRRQARAGKGIPEKVASLLAPVVVLLAWRRTRR